MTKQGAIDYFVARKENGERLLCNKTRKAEDWAITALQSYQEWISVKDRLPDAAGYECLVCAINENYNQMHVFTAHTGYGEPGWWTSNAHYMSKAKSPSDNRLHPALKVTHWMPIPELPKEKGEGQ